MLDAQTHASQSFIPSTPGETNQDYHYCALLIKKFQFNDVSLVLLAEHKYIYKGMCARMLLIE